MRNTSFLGVVPTATSWSLTERRSSLPRTSRPEISANSLMVPAASSWRRRGMSALPLSRRAFGGDGRLARFPLQRAELAAQLVHAACELVDLGARRDVVHVAIRFHDLTLREPALGG